MESSNSSNHYKLSSNTDNKQTRTASKLYGNTKSSSLNDNSRSSVGASTRKPNRNIALSLTLNNYNAVLPTKNYDYTSKAVESLKTLKAVSSKKLEPELAEKQDTNSHKKINQLDATLYSETDNKQDPQKFQATKKKDLNRAFTLNVLQNFDLVQQSAPSTGSTSKQNIFVYDDKSLNSDKKHLHLLNWIECELEKRNVDPNVYGRHILSLLHHDEQLDQQESDHQTFVCEPFHGLSSELNTKYSSCNSSSSNNSSSTTNQSSTIFPKPGKYCQVHQKFHPDGYDHHAALFNHRKAKENTQKAPSTTKWMHKKYLNNLSNNVSPTGSLTNVDVESGHYCPDCAQSGNDELSLNHRKMLVKGTLKSATDDKVSFCFF